MAEVKSKEKFLKAYAGSLLGDEQKYPDVLKLHDEFQSDIKTLDSHVDFLLSHTLLSTNYG